MRPWESAFVDLHRQVDEMFEELVYRPWAISGRTGWRPPLDLHETAEAYLVVLDLPEVDLEDLRIVVGEHDLVVAGRRQPTVPSGVLVQRCERPTGVFERTLRFPLPVEGSRAEAEYRQGTCRIHLPKKGPVPAAAPVARAAAGTRCVLRLTVS